VGGRESVYNGDHPGGFDVLGGSDDPEGGGRTWSDVLAETIRVNVDRSGHESEKGSQANSQD
jgi:hypothetical protein